nr:MAG TPA: hypothetical protein [Caudoviricetes sp.]
MNNFFCTRKPFDQLISVKGYFSCIHLSKCPSLLGEAP